MTKKQAEWNLVALAMMSPENANELHDEIFLKGGVVACKDLTETELVWMVIGSMIDHNEPPTVVNVTKTLGVLLARAIEVVPTAVSAEECIKVIRA